MADIVRDVGMVSLSAASLCLLLALLFVERPRGGWVRVAGVVLAAAAIGVPVLHLGTTMGRADPWPSSGAYLLQGWKIAEENRRIYVMVSSPRFATPRQFELPFDRELALQIQDLQEHALELEKGCLLIEREIGRPPAATLRRLIMRRHQAVFDCARPPPN